MATQVLTEPQSVELQPVKANGGPAEAEALSEPSSGSPPATPCPPADDAKPAIVHSKWRATLVVAQLLGLNLFSSFCNGVVVVGLPAMAASLHIDEGLLVWPTSVFYLTAGSCLLLAGSIADVVGTKTMSLVGAFTAAVSAMACGLAQSSGQLIAFRALQGITNAIIVPSSVSIVSTGLREGRPRNLGFACLGFAGPIGFSLGLVLGGVFADSTGWRAAFYLAAATTFALFLAGIWVLPKNAVRPGGKSIWSRIPAEIDIVGAIIGTASLVMLSYVLAVLSADIHSIHKASTIALLVVSVVLIPAFIGWMQYQEKHQRNALIPNSLWKNWVFTSCCLMVLFTTAVCNCMELYSSLFFQKVQRHSALHASLQILPSLISGALTNISTGIFVNRMPVMWSVLISSTISAVAPLLMALIHPEWPYWYDAFFAQILTPLSCDILFTVGLLVVSDVFPPHMQALSGAVFNTCAQLGTAIGLTVTSLIATSVTNSSSDADKESPDALMDGYRAVFWTMFAAMALTCVLSVLGLRTVKQLGVKRD
ncbi:MFS general substrate transporter [Trichoderma citrinoviride]|uniref:MFS general substrate transporter n=1 Tax=Trichoderma citrinoviride TaxID=58853 RepID=A0A2T4AYW0_9HYPO|nr:MFS general substrate transporter [Trichoderma citrinoviride]PTB62256.1 MFS general substrate transporter [Trichoderma citrinoviride]